MTNKTEKIRELSKTEEKVWLFILIYLEDFKVVPSNKHIAKHLGIKSEYARQYVYGFVKNIERKKSVVFTTERKMESTKSFPQDNV